jgi:hypothetical protein
VGGDYGDLAAVEDDAGDVAPSRCQMFGVVPICAASTSLGVPIAPRTYYAHIERAPFNAR